MDSTQQTLHVLQDSNLLQDKTPRQLADHFAEGAFTYMLHYLNEHPDPEPEKFISEAYANWHLMVRAARELGQSLLVAISVLI